MPDLKSILTDAWRIASAPARSVYLRKAIKAGTVPLGVLFYHRVSNEFPNEWTMTERGFEKQIDWLEKNFEFVSLFELQQRIKAGFNDQPAISITFDDGYADNCNWALPMLIKRNIPVTCFVTTEHTVKGQPFQHDVDAGQILRPHSLEALKSLASAGIEIGAHTRTHSDLGQIQDPETLFDEVVTATRELEKLIDQPIRYFAFPFGQKPNLNSQVFKLARENGFLGVCSTLCEWNHVDSDPFHIKRFHGDPNLPRVKNWLTFDPRKINIKSDPIPTVAPKNLNPVSKKRQIASY